MKEFWDARYANTQYSYGTEPNNYFRAKLDSLEPGRILLPAEGEGRNAVYAARTGWEVHAFDISKNGRKKALELAKANNVTVKYDVGTLEEISILTGGYDAVGLIFAHFPPEKIHQTHRTLSTYIKPGGHVILEGFSKAHLSFRMKNPKVGGPPNFERLFSQEDIANDFSGFKHLECNTTKIELDEGECHIGTGSVIRFFAQK